MTVAPFILPFRPGTDPCERCAVCAYVAPGSAPAAGPVDFAFPSQPRFYARSCYGGSRPATLGLAPGQRADVDLMLGTTSAVWVRGRLLNLPPNPVPTIQLTEDSFHVGGPLLAVDLPKGTFAFQGVAPGRYRLDANVRQQNADGPPKSHSAQLMIDVGTSDVNDIELPLSPAGELDVVLHGPEGKKLEPAAVRIGLRSTASEHPDVRWAEPQRFFLLPPGLAN